MPHWPNSSLMLNFVNRERYLFVFDTEDIAKFWFRIFVGKFGDESVFHDDDHLQISFPDSVYWFKTTEEAAQLHLQEHYRWGLDELRIILDCPEDSN